MPTYRLCRRFTIESGHMLHKHPGRCRFPHGHTRTIEVILRCDHLNEQDMVVDFKAIKLALTPVIEQFDHAMAIHADDPLRPHIDPNAVIVFEEQDPTTEVLAEYLFQCTRKILQDGWMGADSSGIVYQIDSGSVQLDRIRVWETPTSWAEFEDLGT